MMFIHNLNQPKLCTGILFYWSMPILRVTIFVEYPTEILKKTRIQMCNIKIGSNLGISYDFPLSDKPIYLGPT